MRIINAKFLTSSPSLALSPDFGVSEVAFLGRSNVGKSSLINALCGVNSLAKSSQTPGKTQLINFFEVTFAPQKDEENLSKPNLILPQERIRVVFVDLPGFGYAKVSKQTHAQWEKNLSEFLQKRANLRLFVHLKDARHPALEIDQKLEEFLRAFLRGDQKKLTIYTKADKITQSQRNLITKDADALCVSNTKKSGVSEARMAILAGVLGQL